MADVVGGGESRRRVLAHVPENESVFIDVRGIEIVEASIFGAEKSHVQLVAVTADEFEEIEEAGPLHHLNLTADQLEGLDAQDAMEIGRIMARGEKKTTDAMSAGVPVSAVARVAHEANRAWCVANGDDSQPAWDDAPDWQRESAVDGVRFLRDNPLANPIDSHERWMARKLEEGWKFGQTKDPELKTHPCIRPYHELPEAQQRKDWLFASVVRALLRYME